MGVDVCFKVKICHEHKALVITVMGSECVYICFVDSGTNNHCCKL